MVGIAAKSAKRARSHEIGARERQPQFLKGGVNTGDGTLASPSVETAYGWKLVVAEAIHTFGIPRTVDTRSHAPRLYRLITHKFEVTRGTSLRSVKTRGTDPPPRCVLHTTTTQERT